MRVAVFGAGAIGAYLGAKLARVGEDVTLIARGANLAAMQRNGIQVKSPEGDFTARPAVTGDPKTAGPVDFAFLTVKAHSLPEAAVAIGPLLGVETAVVTAQNGVPWWYFQRHGGPLEGTHLKSVDPDGVIAREIEPRRIIGCVVYHGVVLAGPGVVEHVEGDRFSIGELDGASTERCRRLSRALIRSGIKCPIRSNIRREIWVKLLGNVALNPISALTGATLGEIVAHPEASALAREVMGEAEAVAQGLGIELGITVEQRLAAAGELGEHKTSMLQDVEAGRPLEVESIIGAVVELGDKLGLPMTRTQELYALTKLLAEGRG